MTLASHVDSSTLQPVLVFCLVEGITINASCHAVQRAEMSKHLSGVMNEWGRLTATGGDFH